MLILYETPAGYALFKLKDESSLENPDKLSSKFESSDSASKLLSLKSFYKFENTTDALSAATAIVEGKVSKNLKSFLSEQASSSEKLAVADAKLGASIAKKLGLSVVADSSVNELYRGIKSQLSTLITGLSDSDMNAMVLGLSHSLSRYKLKFSPDKVDTMIIQAIALLDDLDKELNTYAMRVKEWYGWHFPEMAKLIVDNIAYAKTIKVMGMRTNASTTDLSDVLPEELESALKEAAEISMGTEISDQDIDNIIQLCDQIISIGEYRTELFDYLKNRMNAIAPNLTALVGELVGARLIAHAGSLMNLAKQPASTVQILGAEKALFRALKSKHDTPKYGLIYHASLVGQAGPKVKGKIARTVATKAALAIRCDALGEGNEGNELGVEQRAKVEARLRQLEGKAVKSNGAALSAVKQQKKVEFKAAASYNPASDVVAMDTAAESSPEKKDKKEKKKEKKSKKEESAPEPEAEEVESSEAKKEKKKSKKNKDKDADAEPSSKKRKQEPEEEAAPETASPEKKKKKKKQKTE